MSANQYVIEYDYRSDGGAMLVGPFPTREAAEEYGFKQASPSWQAEWCVSPLAAPDPE